MKIKESSGRTRKYLIEIKPLKFTQPPAIPKRRTRQFIQEVFQFGVNQAKWKAAREYCENKGWNFEIITEKELGLDK
jgi:hypothetical protein